MKIAWYSNDPGAPTGYGVQTASVVKRMAADGHEVHVLGNYGHRFGVREDAGISVWPEGIVNYSLDIISDITDMVEADVVFTLYDVWVLRGKLWPGKRVLSWTPVDHFPIVPEVRAWAEKHDTIAMSEYGARVLKDAGITPVATIPHTVEPVFRPVGKGKREGMQVPEGAFLVSMNAANTGVQPPRKAWSENLQALALFVSRHDDAYVYFHTDMARPGGVQLVHLIDSLGFPQDRLRVAPPLLYRLGMLDDEQLAGVYSASDVLLAVSKGEGFGVPVIEAMACGVPSIVSDFSAQPELVQGTGWTVEGQLDWDHMQGAYFFTPFVSSILERLEEAYAEWKAGVSRAEACVDEARKYDADTVYDQHWRPLLASLEAPPKPKRKGQSRGSQKKARRAA